MFEQLSGSRPAETGAPSRALTPIRLKPSKRLDLFFRILMMGLAALSLLTLAHTLLDHPLWAGPLLLFWSLILFSWRSYRRWLGRYPEQLSADADSWVIDFPGPDFPGAGQSVPALLVGEVLVWPWLLILPFKLTHTSETYILVCLADSASGEDLRRLRVQLRAG